MQFQTHRRLLTPTSTTTTTTTLHLRLRKSSNILNPLNQILRQVQILLSIKMHWNRWTKWIIKNYRISRRRLNRWHENVMKLKGCYLWMHRVMRRMTMFRAVKDATILFVLASSSTGTLRSVWRCFSH